LEDLTLDELAAFAKENAITLSKAISLRRNALWRKHYMKSVYNRRPSVIAKRRAANKRNYALLKDLKAFVPSEEADELQDEVNDLLDSNS
jgi:hypothetical protein